ncbi:MAG: hypothetical protein RL693_286 [Verrucomicrobiota bacterium]|jgi:hypothetical protein
MNLHMLRPPSLSALIIALALTPLASSFPAEATPAVPDKGLLKSQLQAREARADVLLSELKAADGRIEETIDHVVETLRLVSDSKDSRTKVARIKGDTVTALGKMTGIYQQKRAALQEELRRPMLNLTVEEKQRAISKFDARIEKRVQQILELSKSLPTHKDYEQYKAVDNGWYGTTYVESEDFKQNRRLTTQTNSQNTKIIKELQGSIDRLDRQSRTLNTQLAAATTEAQKVMLAEEIKKTDALIKTRRVQLTEVVVPSDAAARPIGQAEANNFDKALRQTIDSLKRELTTLFQRYSVYLNERSAVNTAKAALEAL